MKTKLEKSEKKARRDGRDFRTASLPNNMQFESEKPLKKLEKSSKSGHGPVKLTMTTTQKSISMFKFKVRRLEYEILLIQ